MTTAAPATIAPHILAIALFLAIGWGGYLTFTIREYRRIRMDQHRDRGEAVAMLRRMVVAFCVFMLPFGFVIRTALVLMGFGNDVAGQILFFALVGTNVPGVVFVLMSLRYD